MLEQHYGNDGRKSPSGTAPEGGSGMREFWVTLFPRQVSGFPYNVVFSDDGQSEFTLNNGADVLVNHMQTSPGNLKVYTKFLELRLTDTHCSVYDNIWD